jgi:hypothetical protein
MMKYITIGILALITIISGCVKKTDNLFSETPDQRLEKVLNAYKDALTGASGWKLFVYPEGLQSQDIQVGGLTYYLKFPDSNRVVMVSNFTIEMASVPKESGYRLKATQRPSLIFDTYSYIHAAADPDETVSFSPTASGGYGWGSDFDFSFVEVVPADTIRLEGNFNNSDAYMIRASQQEMDEAFGGALADIVQATSGYATSNPFLYFPASDNSKIGISFNLFLYRLNFTYVSGGELITIPVPFSHTTYGIHFKDPVSVGGYTFQDLFWDAALQTYYVNTGAGRVNVTNSATPLFPFHIVLGKSVSSISVPATPLPGQSTEFAAVYDQIKENIKNSGYNLDLNSMDFIFDAQSNSMALLVFVEQVGRPFILQYVYSYTINSSNIADFVKVESNVNGTRLEQEMRPLLNYIENDVFKLDYYTAVTPVLGQFTSQDNPGFFFTGNLQ